MGLRFWPDLEYGAAFGLLSGRKQPAGGCFYSVSISLFASDYFSRVQFFIWFLKAEGTRSASESGLTA